jgi:RNA-binding protein
MTELTGKQRRKLRALGHHLTAVVQVGQAGVTDAVVKAANQALEDHELIKVKILEGPADRHQASEQLAEQTGSHLAQLLGRTALLYKQRKKNSKISV